MHRPGDPRGTRTGLRAPCGGGTQRADAAGRHGKQGELRPDSRRGGLQAVSPRAERTTGM